MTKYLWLLAALLSPLQSLQGTHVLCSLVGCPADAADICPGQQLAHSRCGCCHRHLEAGDQRDRQSHGNASLAVAGPKQVPCQCPPDCFCQRLAQPQQVPTAEAPLEPAAMVSLLPAEPELIKCVDGVGSARLSRPSSRCTSALDLCAALCRFTA